MKTYLVGGAVRDKLLGLEVKDRDWVVVGATGKELIALGYRSVGKDFPVFLHPASHEEYALARQERKTAPGYTGFEFDTSTQVTLEQDLLRRDLTINAIAETTDGDLVDPYNGLQDLENRTLRHVSAAFCEDPVRILRVARFAARYAHLGFTVHPSTVGLMSQMVKNHEVDHLVPERIWTETQNALAGASPQVYFQVLRDCGALARVFPEIDALYGVPQPARWHPEIDTGVHTMMVLDQASRLSDSPEIRFAALVHDLGKATTPADILPSHHGHELRSVALVNALCDRLTIPNRYRELALIVAEYHGKAHRVYELRASSLLKLLQQCDAFRRPQRYFDFITACEADARGRTGLETRPYPQADYLRGAHQVASRVSAAEFVQQGLRGDQIAERLNRARLTELKNYKIQHTANATD